MTTKPVNSAMKLERLIQNLNRFHELVQHALRNIKSQQKDVDDIQLELYNLAFVHAELYALERLLQQAESRQLSSQEVALTLAFASDAFSNCTERFRTWLSDVVDIDEALGTETGLLSGRDYQEVANEFAKSDWVIPQANISQAHRQMADSVRKFSDRVVEPIAEHVHRSDSMIPQEVIDGVSELGCFGLSIPTEYGGLASSGNEDTSSMVVVTEELSRGSLGAAGSLSTRPEIIIRALLEGGTEAQKQLYLPKIASGEMLCAVAVTEPDVGSDVASVSLRATKPGDRYRLNGAKLWCTFGGKAHLLLVLARTNPDANPPHRGLSLFLVEKPSVDSKQFAFESPLGGSLRGKAISTIGYRGMHSFELQFDDFCVPAQCLVGEEKGRDRGFYYTMRGFSGGRIQTAARATGLMQAAYERACQYSTDRYVFGKAIAEYRLTQVKLLKMASKIFAIRNMSHWVAGRMDAGEGQFEASLIKLIACKYAEGVCREALQIHGGMGYAEESAVSRYFVDARVLSIFEGAEETLALKVVGKALLDGVV